LFFNILEINAALGENKIEPGSLFDDDDGRLVNKTGIPFVHRTRKTAFDLSIEAILGLSSLKNNSQKIGCVIYVTQSPTNFLPNHASFIQSRFNLPNKSLCFDINQGCSGFVQALLIMIPILYSLESKVGLIICSDTYSHHLSENDRSTQSLFSDGATATLISTEKKWELINSSHYTDGGGGKYLLKSIVEKEKLFMDGAKIFLWTRSVLGREIIKMLEASNLSTIDIDNFFVHQASKLVLDNIAKGLKISTNKIPKTLQITGNLVSSSIPFLIHQNMEVFKLSKKLILSGFGVGLSLSSCIIKNVDR